MRAKTPAIERFNKYFYVAPNGCWIWTGAKSSQGYGWFWNGEKYIASHQFSYEFFIGDIPNGLILGHKKECHNRSCVNWQHVSPMTHRENLLMDDTPSSLNLAKQDCPAGHPLLGTNLHIDRQGSRHCKRCNSIKSAAYGRRKRLERRQQKEQMCQGAISG